MSLIYILSALLRAAWECTIFSEISADEYPSCIAFAFYDGDLYESTCDCFQATYGRLAIGGRVVLDDCGWGELPGVEKAAREAVSRSGDTLHLHKYNNRYGGADSIGLIVKAEQTDDSIQATVRRSVLIPTVGPQASLDMTANTIYSSRMQCGLEAGEPLNKLCWKAKFWAARTQATRMGWTESHDNINPTLHELWDQVGNDVCGLQQQIPKHDS